MKNKVQVVLCALGVLGSGLAFGQRDMNSSGRNQLEPRDRDARQERRDDREFRRDVDRDARRFNDRRDDRQNEFRRDDRRDFFERNMDRQEAPRRDNSGRELLNAYRDGFRDGQRLTERFYREQQEAREEAQREERKNDKRDYKNFTFGVYAGGNSTRFEGEDVDGNALAGRLGWQLGGFIRGGGRVFGQIGFEYLTSSNGFYQKGDGADLKDITGNIDQRYIHVPAYIGIKLAQSPKGISAVRLQLGAQYASPTGVRTNEFNIDRTNFRRSTIMGLANLGFDAGPLFLDLVYQHGFEDVLKESNNSKRRIVGLNVGVKF